MESDPLADVIHSAARSYYAQAVTEHVTAEVRAHLAAVLAAEEAKHQEVLDLDAYDDYSAGALGAIGNLRETLGVPE